MQNLHDISKINENIITVIDFNQLGFNRTTQPKQTLYPFTNNQTLNTTELSFI